MHNQVYLSSLQEENIFFHVQLSVKSKVDSYYLILNGKLCILIFLDSPLTVFEIFTFICEIFKFWCNFQTLFSWKRKMLQNGNLSNLKLEVQGNFWSKIYLLLVGKGNSITATILKTTNINKAMFFNRMTIFSPSSYSPPKIFHN